MSFVQRRGARWLLVSMVALACACGDDDGNPTDGGTTDGSMSDGGDACVGVTQCAAVGTTCAGDALVTCALDARGCRIETRTDCTTTDQVCDASGSAAMCVTPDVCAGVENACETEGRACDGASLVVCAPNEDGCLVATTTDCAEMPGGVCDDSGDAAMCVLPADPCMGLTNACTVEGTSCDGTNLVTCAPNAFGCLVESTDDCATRASGTCEPGEVASCTFTGDPCADVTECTPGAPSCDGPSLVTCEADAFGCFVETRTDCTDAPFGFCDADAATPICSTAAVDPCMGVTECDPVGRACDTDTLDVCALNAFGCAVSTRTDCTTDGDVCDATSGTAACVDPCTLVTTCATASSCAAGEVVTCAPDANGCLVESGRTACDSGTICDTPMGAGECIADACPAAPAVVLDCTSGTVSGDTADGSAAITSYPGCTSSTNYASSEQLHRFRSASRQRVTIVATRGAADGDFDLFVTRPAEDGSCADATACVDGSTNLSSNPLETVEFVAQPSELYYVSYDKFGTSGAATSAYTLTITCEPIVCGDGIVDEAEECDDGDTDSMDGCSSTCTVEDEFACDDAEPSVCNRIECGDGRVQGTEACDDGDTDDGDGCSMTCEVEADYLCSGDAPSTCVLACGNGNVESARGEACDDGDRDDGDGCSATCTLEPGFRCTGTMPTTCLALAPNATCAGAAMVEETSTYLAANLALGGDQPTATGCGGGTSNRTLYYAVTLPASSRVDVTTTPGSNDIVLFFLDACDAAACSYATDASPERGALVNTSASPITRIVGVRSYNSATPTTVDVSFAFSSVSYAPNATCATATAVTADATFSAEPLAQGGPRPSGSGCGTGTGDATLYYSVTVPAGQRVNVQTTPGSDLVLFTQNACTDAGCATSTNTAPESTVIENRGETTIVRVVGVRAQAPMPMPTPYDISFTYETIPTIPNALCSGATVITEDTTLTAQNLALGGTRPMGTNCGNGTGNLALYYAVTVPARQWVDVQTTPGSDIVLFTQSACGDVACLSSTDSSPESTRLENRTDAAITRIVGVRSYGAAASPFDIAFAYQAIPTMTNTTCETATAIASNTTLMLQDLAAGGTRPMGTNCGGGAGNVALYYTVTVPAGRRLDVQTTPGSDIVLFTQNACGDVGCLSSTDSSPERTTILNDRTTPITRVVGVRSYDTGAASPFDITFTYTSLAYVYEPIAGACVDVSGGSAIAGVTSDDSVSTVQALPIAFDFFGAPVLGFTVTSNGFMQLMPAVSGTGSTSTGNATVPSSGGPNGFIAPFWDDLEPASGGAGATFLVDGAMGSRRMVVEWTNWQAYDDASGALTFQAHLFEGTNAIELHYCSMNATTGTRHSGGSATVGVENGAGTAGLQISYDTAGAVMTGSGFRITTP
ncbi:MAG: DUF4215 domain-containing protein [Sandaracinus sp.]|nr:DUF4215 domain-containing protein [Sandaracinus sp.]